jgi:hypothetical protein
LRGWRIPAPLEGKTYRKAALDVSRKPNLSDEAKEYLAGLGFSPEDGAGLLFYHALAVLHSPVYRVENAGALRQDWPRVPLPKTRETVESSAALGWQVAALLDVETPVPGVTQGDPRDDLQTIAVLTTADGRAPDFTMNAGWGYFGGSGTCPVAVVPSKTMG